jgi:hypothetical protein
LLQTHLENHERFCVCKISVTSEVASKVLLSNFS